MEFPWNPNTKWEKPQSSISMHPFSPAPEQNQQISKKCCLPPLFFKINLRDTSFHISLNCLGFCLTRMLVKFSLNCVGKRFQITVPTFLENALNLCIFTHAPVPHTKLQVEFFENLFSPRPKGCRKLWFALSKFNQKIWRCLEH